MKRLPLQEASEFLLHPESANQEPRSRAVLRSEAHIRALLSSDVGQLQRIIADANRRNCRVTQSPVVHDGLLWVDL